MPVESNSRFAPEAVRGYEILHEVGHGGMGVVFQARDCKLDRDVAIKVLTEKAAATNALVARFVAEAKITGQLQHPGIPAVHELGALANGRPFLAMKLVKGQTLQALIDQCRTRGTDKDVASRGRLLAAFEHVCHAVGYAHAQRVIHRDLKPANVMVGAFGEVQVMDWGLAKVLDPGKTPEARAGALADGSANGDDQEEDAGATAAYVTDVETPGNAGSDTETGAVLGTPAYMPPEQAAGDVRRLDARSDVFGLGAILCAILTGKPPYEGKNRHEVHVQALAGDLRAAQERLGECGADRALVALCTQCLSAKPEDRPSDGQAVAAVIAQVRQAAEERARQAEQERAAAVAREAEQSKRRRLLLLASAVVVAVLVAGIIGTSVGMVKANNAADAEKGAKEVTQRRLTQIEKGVELFAGMLSGINPRNEEVGGPTVYQQLRERAVEAADELNAEAVGDPQAVARLQALLGNTLRELGEYPKAIAVLEKALATRRVELGDDADETLTTQADLASACRASGDLARAIPLFEQVRDAQERRLGPSHEDTVSTMNSLAIAYGIAGRYTDAIAQFEHVRNTFAATLGPDDADTLTASSNLALAYEKAGKLALAITNLEQVRDARMRTLGPDHVDTLTSLHNLGSAYLLAGQVPEGIAILEKAREASVQKFGVDHPDTALTLNSLALAYKDADRVTEAIALCEQARDVQLRKIGPDHPDTLITLHNLALAYHRAGRLDEALLLFEQVRDTSTRKLGADHPDTLNTRNALARVYQARGRLAEAIATLEQVRDVRTAKLGADHLATLQTAYDLAMAYWADNRLSAALPLLEQAAVGMEKLAFQYQLARQAMPNVIRAYETAGEKDKAALWQSKWLAHVKNEGRAAEARQVK